MWRRNYLLYLQVINFFAHTFVAETDEPSARETPCVGSCCNSHGYYEVIKQVAKVEIKQSQLEEVTTAQNSMIAAQKSMIESQQVLITRLQQQLTGLETKVGNDYNYQDVFAQAACISIHPGGQYVYAVRRECSAQTVECNEICKSLGKTCFNALQFHSAVKLDDSAKGVIGMKTYKYNSCSGLWYCGPNFCCCADN